MMDESAQLSMYCLTSRTWRKVAQNNETVPEVVDQLDSLPDTDNYQHVS